MHSNDTSAVTNKKQEIKTIEWDPEVKPEVILNQASPSRIQKLFYNWTNFVQNHPFWIILVSISFILFMMSGLIFIDFTTDPIKLWTSSESRSYKEYVKYNKYFGPFYRTQQIIATLKPDYDSVPGRDDLQASMQAKGVAYSICFPAFRAIDMQQLSSKDYLHTDINGKIVPFDPVLDSKYWPELMQLQENITNLHVTQDNDTLAFDDVCLNPLSDDMDPTAGGCTIFSGGYP